MWSAPHARLAPQRRRKASGRGAAQPFPQHQGFEQARVGPYPREAVITCADAEYMTAARQAATTGRSQAEVCMAAREVCCGSCRTSVREKPGSQ